MRTISTSEKQFSCVRAPRLANFNLLMTKNSNNNSTEVIYLMTVCRKGNRQARCNIKSTVNHSHLTPTPFGHLHSHPTPTPYYSYQTIRASSDESSKNWASECSVADTLSFSDLLSMIAVINVLPASMLVINDQRRCPIIPFVD